METFFLSSVLSFPPPFYCITFQLVTGVEQNTQFSDLLENVLTVNISTCLLSRRAVFPERKHFSEKRNRDDKTGGIR